MKYVTYLIACSAWIVGVVLAQGFWSTLFSVILPFWAWYLVAEKVLIAAGWL